MRIIEVLGFIRGALAAISLLGIAETILPYSALDVVSGVHAIIIGWNFLVGAMGSALANALGLPEIPVYMINAMIVIAAIGPPFVLAVLNAEWGLHYGIAQNIAFAVRILCMSLMICAFSINLVSTPPGSVVFFFSISALTPIFVAVLLRYPAYRSGVLTLLGFLLVSEAIYLASTNSAQDYFDQFVCEHADTSAHRCG